MMEPNREEAAALKEKQVAAQKEKEQLRGHISMSKQEKQMREQMLKEVVDTMVKYNSSSLADYIEAEGNFWYHCWASSINSTKGETETFQLQSILSGIQIIALDDKILKGERLQQPFELNLADL